MTNKIFQLVKSIFSFHVVTFFLLCVPKARMVIKRLKHENWNALSQLKCQIKIPRNGTRVFKSNTLFLWEVVFTVASTTPWKFFILLTQNSFQNNRKSVLWLENKFTFRKTIDLSKLPKKSLKWRNFLKKPLHFWLSEFVRK